MAADRMPERFVHRIESLSEISRLINSGEDLDTILERIVYAVCRHTDWVMSGILTIDEEAGLSRVVKRFDPYASERKYLPDSWDLSTSPVRDVIRDNVPLIIPDALHSEDYPTYREDARLRGYRTTIVLPLDVADDKGRPMVLSVQSREPIDVGNAELSFLTTVADLAAIAVDKAVRLQSERSKSEKLRAAVDAYTHLMPPVLTGSTVETMAGELDRFIASPWAVVDLAADEVVVGRSPLPESLDHKAWRSWVAEAGRRPLIDLAAAQDAPGESEGSHCEIAIGKESLPCPVHVQSLNVDGELVGGLILFGAQDALDDVDQLQAQAVRLALGALMMRNVVRFRAEAASQGAIVRKLISGDLGDRADFLKQASAAKLDLGAPCRLIVLAGSRASELGTKSTPVRLHQSVTRLTHKLFDAQSTVELDGLFLALVPPREFDEEAMARRYRQIFESYKWHAGHGPTMVFGEVCRDLADYQGAYVRAERPIDLARSLEVTGLVTAKDFGSFPMLMSLAEKSTVQDFLANTILPLLTDQKARRGDLLETLRSFVDNEGRYQSCAEQLGVHVSTLRYRLDRIAERFGLDVTRPDTRFDLQLAFKLHDVATKIKQVS